MNGRWTYGVVCLVGLAAVGAAASAVAPEVRSAAERSGGQRQPGVLPALGLALRVDPPEALGGGGLLLWRKYVLEEGRWIANCCPVEVGPGGLVPLQHNGLIVKGRLFGPATITVWLAAAMEPYRPVTRPLDVHDVVNGYLALPEAVETATECRIDDVAGPQVAVRGRFRLMGNEALTFAKASGRTDEGLLLGGAWMNSERMWGVYEELDATAENQKVREVGCTALEGATEFLKARYRTRGAALLEVHKKD